MASYGRFGELFLAKYLPDQIPTTSNSIKPSPRFVSDLNIHISGAKQILDALTEDLEAQSSSYEEYEHLAIQRIRILTSIAKRIRLKKYTANDALQLDMNCKIIASLYENMPDDINFTQRAIDCNKLTEFTNEWANLEPRHLGPYRLEHSFLVHPEGTFFYNIYLGESIIGTVGLSVHLDNRKQTLRITNLQGINHQEKELKRFSKFLKMPWQVFFTKLIKAEAELKGHNFEVQYPTYFRDHMTPETHERATEMYRKTFDALKIPAHKRVIPRLK